MAERFPGYGRTVYDSGTIKGALYAKLFKKTQALCHQVTRDEMKADPQMPHPNDYAYYWRTFDDAAAEAWYAVQWMSANQELWDAQEAQRLVVEDHRAANKVHDVSDAEIAAPSYLNERALLYRLTLRYGALPTVEQIQNEATQHGTAIYSTLRRHFGTHDKWPKILQRYEDYLRAKGEKIERPIAQVLQRVQRSCGGKNAAYTETEILEAYCRVYDHYGRWPTVAEINAVTKTLHTPTAATIKKYLGGGIKNWQAKVERYRSAQKSEQGNT